MTTDHHHPMAQSNIVNLEALLFKATNPTNKLEDVNTIKQFCDAVSSAAPEGPVIACRLLAHKIQSPQEREALQALAVLEACVKACGAAFHAEVGRFKFLNEMIKLVSPRYLAPRTPEHIKKKVIELLYLWTKELKSEGKIAEAYDMLKKQGIVASDPDYVGGAVFAASLPPRPPEPLSEDQSKLLKRLLQSKNPDDLQQANKIIKELVKEDERKMDALTRRSTELIMVNNNSRLLNEMLDHYDKVSSGPEELELFKELFQSCEKMQPKLFRLAAESDENDESILDILQASDDLSRVIDRYKMVILQGKPDITKPMVKQVSEQLLDLDHLPRPPRSGNNAIADDDILRLGPLTAADLSFCVGLPEASAVVTESPSVSSSVNNDNDNSASAASLPPQPSIDDLLNGPLIEAVPPSLLINSLPSSIPKHNDKSPFDRKMEELKTSRQKGLEELDFLGETAIKSHLTSRSPLFEKRNEKVPMNKLLQQQPKKEVDLTQSLQTINLSNPVSIPPSSDQAASIPNPQRQETRSPNLLQDIKLSELEVPLESIKPGSIPPMSIQNEDDGVSIVLNFGRDPPCEHVTAVVVTIINKTSSALSSIELKAAVPKGCKVRLQTPSGSSLPAHNPFVPPSAITQVMLVANPERRSGVWIKYVLSYVQDGEAQTEMGEAKDLPV